MKDMQLKYRFTQKEMNFIHRNHKKRLRIFAIILLITIIMSVTIILVSAYLDPRFTLADDRYFIPFTIVALLSSLSYFVFSIILVLNMNTLVSPRNSTDLHEVTINGNTARISLIKDEGNMQMHTFQILKVQREEYAVIIYKKANFYFYIPKEMFNKE